MTTVWKLFAAAEAEHGDSPAVLGEGPRLSYAELGRRVRGLAAELLLRGVSPGDRVAILDLNSVLYLEATFAVAAVAPRELILCDALPKTGSGKISKASLRGEASSGVPEGSVRPGTDAGPAE